MRIVALMEYKNKVANTLKKQSTQLIEPIT
jgi:hypothetical protein